MAAIPEIKLNESDLLRITLSLQGVKNGAAKVMAGAINDTLSQGRTKLAKDTTDGLNLKRASFKRRIKIRKASQGYLTGRLTLKEYKPPNILSYGGKPNKPSPKNKRGISYTAFKGAGRTRVKDAFVAKSRSGVLLAFRREGQSRYPIEPVYGPSVTRFITQAQIDAHTMEFMAEKLPQRIRGRTYVVLQKAGLI